MPKAPELGFSAVGSQSDSCCHSASRHENCAAPISPRAYDRASSTLGAGAGAGTDAGSGATGSAVAAGATTFPATDVDPRPAPSERETVTARSPSVSTTGLTMELAIGLATALVLVSASAVSERGVAGASALCGDVSGCSARAASRAQNAIHVTASRRGTWMFTTCAQRCVRLEHAGHLRSARPGEQASAWLRIGRGPSHARTVEATKVTWAESGRIRAFGGLPHLQLIPDVHSVQRAFWACGSIARRGQRPSGVRWICLEST